MDLRLVGLLAAFIITLYMLGDGGDSHDDGEERDRAPERGMTDNPVIVTLHQMEK